MAGKHRGRPVQMHHVQAVSSVKSMQKQLNELIRMTLEFKKLVLQNALIAEVALNDSNLSLEAKTEIITTAIQGIKEICS